jgi:hypothetical protein
MPPVSSMNTISIIYVSVYYIMTLYKKIIRYYLNDSKNLDDIQYFHTLYNTATANLSCDCNGFQTTIERDYESNVVVTKHLRKLAYPSSAEADLKKLTEIKTTEPKGKHTKYNLF